MDPDLADRFDRIESQLGRLDGIEEQLGRLDGIEEQLGRLDGIEEQLGRLDGIEEELRQVHVVVEDQRATIQTVAEGVASNDEKITRLRAEMKEEFEEVRSVLHLRSIH